VLVLCACHLFAVNKAFIISLFPLVVHNLTANGQKEIEHTQDAGLELLEAYIKQSTKRGRMAKLLLFLGQVKAVSKDIAVQVEDKRVIGYQNDAVLLELLS